MNNKIFNIFKISLLFLFISNYSFSNEITLNVKQTNDNMKGVKVRCWFIADAYNTTNLNLTALWIKVVYYDKDGYVIDRGNWLWERLRPNKKVMIDDLQSSVDVGDPNMPCNQVGRVELTHVWYLKIDGEYQSDDMRSKIYDLIKVDNNLLNIQVVKN